MTRPAQGERPADPAVASSPLRGTERIPRIARSRRIDLAPLPLWVAVLAVLSVAYLVVPIVLMGGRVDWMAFPTHLASDSARQALTLSMKTCAIALGMDVVLGVPLALWLAKGFRGVRVVRVLVALPLAMPPVVAGLALISAFGRQGLIGSALEDVGVRLAFSTTAVIMAQVFVSLPFLVVTLEAALRARPEGMEETAASLGAGPSRIVWQVTLPMVAPGVGRGSALALARCLGEFGATLTFAGSMTGITRTMPLEIYLAREESQQSALALGILLLAMAVGVVGLTELPARIRRGARLDLPDDNRPVELADNDADPCPGVSGHYSASASSAPVAASVSGEIYLRDWALDVALPAGVITAIVGPNGAGKSTLAQVLAGKLALDDGTCAIGQRTVDGPGVFVSARHRNVAMVDQNPRIFSHMSVIDNVAFPLRCQKVPRALAHEAALEQLRLVGCAHLAHRRGNELSGGQAARVSLARALVFAPDVLILDEPTAALDVQARAEASRVLQHRLANYPVTTLVVTHDVVEALQLASHVLVVEDGRLVEEGDPTQVFTRPTSVFAAHLAGLNVITGQAMHRDDLLTIDVGSGSVAAPTGQVTAEASKVAMLFDAEAVAISHAKPTGSVRGVFPASVDCVDASGGLVTVGLRTENGHIIRARVTTAAWAEMGVPAGNRLWCSVKATQVRAVPLPT